MSDLNKYVPDSSYLHVDEPFNMKLSEIEEIRNAVLQFPGCRIIQIGTCFGLTAFSLIDVLEEVGGFLDTIDFDHKKNKTVKRARKGIAHVERVIAEKKLQSVMKLHTQGSDYFFANVAHGYYNVIFVDGDHAYGQAKRDLYNSVNTIAPGGIIFMHDIKPRVSYLPVSKSCTRVYNSFHRDGWQKFHDRSIHDMAKIVCPS